MSHHLALKLYLPALALLLLLPLLGHWPTQGDFPLLLALYAPAFALYVWLCRTAPDSALRGLLLLAILLRITLLPGLPQLSDDVYRFIWDGRLLLQGINPFAQLPTYYMQPGNALPGLTPSLYQQLNSPDYFTIYPPVAQGVFAFSCWLFPSSILGSAVVIKVFLLFCEAGTCWLMPDLLRRLGLPPRNALWYALNPLAILEITGNLHFEGAMIFFFLLSIWCLTAHRWLLAAGAMALSIAAKLLPLLFLFFFVRRLGWKKAFSFFAVVGLSLLLLFSPLLNESFLHGFTNSLDLYFRQFEFNASLYYLLRQLGYWYTGYNEIAIIGPYLALAVFLLIALAALFDRRRDWRSLFPLCLLAIGIYLALATTVHPWYSLLPLALCPFTRFRWPVLWTFLIALTYINYSYDPYWENTWIVTLEYTLLFGFVAFECRPPLIGQVSKT